MNETDYGPKYLLRGVPNDAAGRAFIAQLRAFLNKDRWEVILRGNAPAKDGKVYPYGVPTGQASTLRVYVTDKENRYRAIGDWRARQVIQDIRATLRRLDAD